jgi:hypothetical protein
MSSPVVRSGNVLNRNSMRFAAALLAPLASFVAGPNVALAAAPQHHDQVRAVSSGPAVDETEVTP